MLFAGMTAELETDAGVLIPMQATGMKGAKVWATAPRHGCAILRNLGRARRAGESAATNREAVR